MKTLAIIWLSIGLLGCTKEAEEVRPTGNINYQVDKLFTHEGCTVYRFDDGKTIYYVKCENGETKTQWQTKRVITSGKVTTVTTQDHHVSGDSI